jgi:TPR repeat protein
MNDTEAVKWFRKAAAQGHAKAQKNLKRTHYENVTNGTSLTSDPAAETREYEAALNLFKANRINQSLPSKHSPRRIPTAH